jgi:hypothetical protein
MQKQSSTGFHHLVAQSPLHHYLSTDLGTVPTGCYTKDWPSGHSRAYSGAKIFFSITPHCGPFDQASNHRIGMEEKKKLWGVLDMDVLRG